MSTDALRRLQALRGLTRTGSTHTVLAQVQGDLQTVIEAVLELADENTPPASQNGPQDARSADSGTDGPPEPENAVQGRIGWLRMGPGNKRRLLTQEVPGGWADADEDGDPLWLAKDWPNAEFTPIRTLADDEVAVKRDDLPAAIAALGAVARGWSVADAEAARRIADRLRRALEAGEDA